MGPQARMATGNATPPEAGVSADAAQGAGPFVINLCSSTTPMALSQPDAPEMKRFSFFVSRRREDNRERFRLHMGYFSTLAEAEEWLNVVRDVYPGAWAGEAPGKRLRARAAAAALANDLPAPPSVAPRVVSVTAKPTASVPAVARQALPSATDLIVPTLQAAAPEALAPKSTGATGMHRAIPDPASTVSPRAPTNATGTHHAITSPAAPVQPAPVATPAAPAPTRVAASPTPAAVAPPAARSPAPAPKAPAAAQPTRAPVKSVPKKQPAVVPPALSGSNVREVMAALDETGETRQMRAPQFTSNPPAGAARSVPASTKVPVSQQQSAPAAEGGSTLSDTQVLRFLEQRREESNERSDEGANAGISLLKPDDTQTRLALKDAVRDNAPVSFAVQLHWSVSPIQLEKVPPLAIFSAYTLYTVEGSREGRKWYGLRLGFFSDAISAKQVAYYVRSEFTTVAVVPVSPQEKVRAGAEETRAATGRLAKPNVPAPRVDEFKLFDDEKPADGPAIAPAAAAAVAGKAAAPAAKAGVKPAPKKNKPLGKVRAREPKSAKTLEETLEILGASDLEIDNGRGEVLNDTGVRHLRVEVQKNTPFAKLLDRLSEKVRRN